MCCWRDDVDQLNSGRLRRWIRTGHAQRRKWSVGQRASLKSQILAGLLSAVGTLSLRAHVIGGGGFHARHENACRKKPSCRGEGRGFPSIAAVRAKLNRGLSRTGAHQGVLGYEGMLRRTDGLRTRTTDTQCAQRQERDEETHPQLPGNAL